MEPHKRRREADEAHERTNKHHRTQEKPQNPSPLPPPDPRNNDEPESRPQLDSQSPQQQPGPSHAVNPDPESSDDETSTCYSKDVATYDVEPGVRATGRPDVEEFECCLKVDGAVEFMSSKSGLEGNWVGVWPLGKGGNGIAGLWELRDHDGRPAKVCSRTP